MRVAHDLETNEIWFCAQDVCKCLELNNVSKATSDILDSEKTNIVLNDNGFNYKHRQLFVTESGLYMLIMRSRKPVAKPFQRWVTCVVLPSICKHGSYVMGQENLPAEDRVLLLETEREMCQTKERHPNIRTFLFMTLLLQLICIYIRSHECNLAFWRIRIYLSDRFDTSDSISKTCREDCP